MSAVAPLRVALSTAIGISGGSAAWAQDPDVDVPTGVANALGQACNELVTDEGQQECTAGIAASSLSVGVRWSRAVSNHVKGLEFPENLGATAGQQRMHLGTILEHCGPLDMRYPDSAVENTIPDVTEQAELCLRTVQTGAEAYPDIAEGAEITDAEITVIETIRRCVEGGEYDSCEIPNVIVLPEGPIKEI